MIYRLILKCDLPLGFAYHLILYLDLPLENISLTDHEINCIDRVLFYKLLLNSDFILRVFYKENREKYRKYSKNIGGGRFAPAPSNVAEFHTVK